MSKRCTFGEFKLKTKKSLAQKAGHSCSNPNCRHKALYLDSGGKQQNCGEAAHILGRGFKSARYKPLLTADELASEQNGIWLCSRCHTVIDNDPIMFPVEVLRAWKTLAEGELIYTSPTPIITPPGHFFKFGDGAISIGLHVLVAPCSIPGVVIRLELEIVSEFGSDLCRPTKYFDSTPSQLGVLQNDWRRFLFTNGCDYNLYFAWSPTTDPYPIPDGALMLLRLMVTGRYNGIEIPDIKSDWEPVCITTSKPKDMNDRRSFVPRFDALRVNSAYLLSVAPFLQKAYLLENGKDFVTDVLRVHAKAGTHRIGTMKGVVKDAEFRLSQKRSDTGKCVRVTSTDHSLNAMSWEGGYVILEMFEHLDGNQLRANLIEHWHGDCLNQDYPQQTSWRKHWATERSEIADDTIYRIQ